MTLPNESHGAGEGPQFGDALAAALRERGRAVSREEAAELARALLHLAELGLLVPIDDPDECD